ncbi:MAG: RagB/SusD family nutrient uptake outer membrane protein [Sphingobacteriaceae bacterium]
MTVFNKTSASAKLLVCFIGLFVITGCKKLDNFLDKAESGGTTEEAIFADYNQTQGYLANIYSDALGAGEWMPQTTFTYAAATDEAFCPYPRPLSPLTFNNGTLSPTNNPVDMWNSLYRNVRKVNRMLQHIDNVPATTPDQVKGKPRMKGEAYFFRAYLYFGLFKRYGAVPIVERVLNIDENLNLPRNSVQEVVDFIVQDCNKAIELLPPTYELTDLGRATKGAAMMIKARALLYAASPLHNPTKDLAKWKLAADASKDIIDLKIYSLDNNYKTLFHTRTSPEIIFQSTINHVWNVTSQDWVRHTQPPSQGGGWGNLQPTQNLVDDYEMKDGTRFNWNNPTHAANPYANRDPRFHMSIIYNDRPWAGSTIKTFVASGTVDALGTNNPASTQTGYYAAKLLDESSTLVGSYRGGSHFWVFMRYAEVLLNYAEARNEHLAEPDADVYKYVNEVRSRTGVAMPGLPTNLSKDDMRIRIHQERRIELAFETHRFWDVRRWQRGTELFTDALGMRITRTGTTYKYEKIITEKRSYRPAFNLFPIPQNEVENNKALVQNPGYN